MSEVRLVFLNSLRLFEARLIAAQLGAEGIVWELRGVDPNYPAGFAEIWVDAVDFDRACELLVVGVDIPDLDAQALGATRSNETGDRADPEDPTEG